MARLISLCSGEVIPVPEGDSSIGRGPLLKVNDKRVSRNHALLSLKDGRLSLCPKHVNPCFYKSRGQTAYSRLVKDRWQDLHCQDHFSLLPKGELTFRVVSNDSDPSYVDQVSSCDPPKPTMAVSAQSQTPAIVDTDHSRSDPTMDDMLFGNPSPRASPNARASPEESNFKDDSHQDEGKQKLFSVTTGAEDATKTSLSISSSYAKDTEKHSPTELVSSGKRRVLPGWLCSASTAERPISSTSKKAPKGVSQATKRKMADRRGSMDASPASSLPPASFPKGVSQATKRKMADRSGSLDESPASSLPPAKKPSLSSEKEAAAAAPSQSEKTSTTGNLSYKLCSQRQSLSPEKDGISSKAAVTAPSQSEETSAKATDDVSGRPSCPYGTKCYRKNPIHFREYSHDFAAASDSEDSGGGGGGGDGESDKPVCRYGAQCFRKNPEHRREYSHFAGSSDRDVTSAKTRRRAGKGTKKSVLTGDSDEDSQPNTYDYQDSFIDDHSVSGTSSSYGNDSEDSEWAMPAGEKGEEEDLDELIAEADEFMSDVKMRK